MQNLKYLTIINDHLINFLDKNEINKRFPGFILAMIRTNNNKNAYYNQKNNREYHNKLYKAKNFDECKSK
ncbi:MAG: hypothetical protein AMS24_01595 [Chlamydiae bacterium SM23_39]|nr:MAG: hypothetical protein AMS24_01595 [Chlamydiae bacterium SM23_39]